MVALVEVKEVAAFESYVRQTYKTATDIEPEVYPVQAAAGAGELQWHRKRS